MHNCLRDYNWNSSSYCTEIYATLTAVHISNACSAQRIKASRRFTLKHKKFSVKSSSAQKNNIKKNNSSQLTNVQLHSLGGVKVAWHAFFPLSTRFVFLTLHRVAANKSNSDGWRSIINFYTIWKLKFIGSNYGFAFQINAEITLNLKIQNVKWKDKEVLFTNSMRKHADIMLLVLVTVYI